MIQGRRTYARRCIALSAAGVCTAIVGCGGANMAPVSGTVQHNGVVLSGGRIVFRPIGEGAVAQAPIQSDGTFRLTTKNTDDGAVVGNYRVMIAGDDKTADPRMRASYMGPKDRPLEVVRGKDNQFVIDVREKDGWQVLGDNN
jgi:hypothetical protein